MALGHSPDGAWWRRVEMSTLSRLRSALDVAIADVCRSTGCSGAHLRLPLSAPSDAALLNETKAIERLQQNMAGAEPEREPEKLRAAGFSAVSATVSSHATRRCF